MNRFTLLSALMLVFSINLFSQGGVELPTQNSYKLHTYAGSFLEAKEYAGGVAFLGNDGTDDFSAYSLDGETFSVAETFSAGTGSLLSAWSNNTISFYQGGLNVLQNINQNVLNNGTHAIISALSDTIVTNVIHMNYGDLGGGDLGDRYYYIGHNGEFDPISGQDISFFEYNPYTQEVKEVTDNAGFGKSYVATGSISSGTLEQAQLNGKLYTIIGMPGNMGPDVVIARLDFDPTGTSATQSTLFAEGDAELISFKHLVSFGDYLYTILYTGTERSTDRMVAINEAGEKVYVGNEMSFAPYKPVVAGSKMFAIQETSYSDVKKLAVISAPDQVRVVHINAESENDSINNITIGGDKVFFTAKTTTGTSGLYAMLIEDDNAQPVLVKDLGTDSIANLTSLTDGVAYSMYVGDDSYFIYACNGFEPADYMLHRGVEDGSFAWGDIKSIVVNGDVLYISEDDLSGNINIWSHDINDVTRKGCDVQFTVQDVATSALIPGATLTLYNDFYSYTGTTNAAGQVIFMDLPYANSFKDGWSSRNYRYDLEASGYQSVMDSSIWLNTGAQEKTLTMIADDPNGIEDVNTEFKVFPTCVTNQLTIQATQNIQRLEIYNISGVRVMDINSPAGNTIDVSSLANGIYVIVIEGTNVQETTKFIKK